ncbi:MAG TPA: F0F1 ATP synthase subunit A [Pyrinomonadaceae bacterium]|nr:F0F1 ATP synthase subunit A [Pyrinomonadaceae bacterium]
MFWLETANAAEHGEKAAASAHHTPIIVELVNHYFGQPVYEFQIRYTYPLWKSFFAKFHTTPEAVFGPYTPETAIPWYTVMFVIACILTVTIIWIFKGKLSTEEPGPGQQTLEVGVLAVRGMLEDIVGPHGLKYFPIVMTFAVLILVSNLMGQFPLFMSPTAATSVTFALGLSSFLYYNYVGIAENGLLGHLKHLAGPIWWISFLIFPIEVISNFIRPFSLGIRLFGNIFADEQVVSTVASIYPPWTQWVLPVLLMPLGVFVAFVQTFVFILLSQLYLSEVSHAPHEGHDDHGAQDIHASPDQHEALAVS